jgi:hypothetical protein
MIAWSPPVDRSLLQPYANSSSVELKRGAVVSPVEVHAAANRIRGEFLEMPGLRLTIRQAARLWGLEPAACEHVIELLVQSAFLRWTPGGMVARLDT